MSPPSGNPERCSRSVITETKDIVIGLKVSAILIILIFVVAALISGCAVLTSEQHAAKHGVVLECRCLPLEYETKCLVSTESGPKTYIYKGVCEEVEVRETRRPIPKPLTEGVYNPYGIPQTGNEK